MTRRKCALPRLSHLDKLGSLITFKAESGGEHCLGYLWHVKGHGTFDPNYGNVNVCEEHAHAHNKCLDAALLDRLDNQCEVGQGNMFYLNVDGAIVTFTGAVVATNTRRVPGRNTRVFNRGTRLFKASRRGHANDNLVWVERTA